MATIRYLAEQALTAYLNSVPLSVAAVAGTSTVTKDAPIVICTVQEWTEDEHDLNWFRLRATVETKALASAGVAAFDALCSEVQAALRKTTLGTLLAAAQAGIVFASGGTSAPDKGSFSIADDVWTETRELELYCSQP